MVDSKINDLDQKGKVVHSKARNNYKKKIEEIDNSVAKMTKEELEK